MPLLTKQPISSKKVTRDTNNHREGVNMSMPLPPRINPLNPWLNYHPSLSDLGSGTWHCAARLVPLFVC